jgi:polysaccharide pyruvyl transferase WcaK-like protein
VTVVNWPFSNGVAGRAHYVRVLADVADEVHRQFRLPALLVPQVTLPFYGRLDAEIAREVATAIRSRNVPCHGLIDQDLSPAELSLVYGRCSLLLGTRLHSCILAACGGTPPLAVSYLGPKTMGVLGALGLGSHVQHIENLDATRLAESACGLIGDRQAISASIERRVAEFRQELVNAARRYLLPA